MADGANAELDALVRHMNVVKSGPTTSWHAHLHFRWISQRPEAGRDLAPKLPGPSSSGPRGAGDKLFFFLAMGNALQTDRANRPAAGGGSGFGSPNRTAIERTNDARVFLLDWQRRASTWSRCGTTTWAEQKNGTFDVDSWGRAPTRWRRTSQRGDRPVISSFSPKVLNEFRFQFAREDRPRPYGGPNITGQSRPLPDTAFDFGKGYRFGMPFFLPVEYYDTRIQFNNNLSIIAGRHNVKMGFEFNRVTSVQTFIGFANGRYIFSSTDGFLRYTKNPNYVECSNGTTSETGSCPAGSSVTGPVLLYLQQAGVGGLSVEEAGTQDIPQTEPAVFIQDKWQPTRSLTVQAGLRWEAQIEPDPITPPDQVFFAPFIETVQTSRAHRF